MQFLKDLYLTNLTASEEAPNPTAFAQNGSRLEFERAYFARRKVLSAAALLYFTEGGEEYFAAANRAADAILSEPTWVHPAHGDSIDLFCAETGFLLAELAAKFPFGGELRARILAAVEKNVVTPYCTQTFGWEKEGGNWLAVCAGNVAGALYYTNAAAFAAQRERLKGVLERYLCGFPADGWCAEGMEYWNFGFGAFVRAAELCFPELLTHPMARAVASYPQKCFLCENTVASFSDCPMAGRADRGLVNFLHKAYGLPLLTEEETYIRAENCAWMPLSRGLRDGFAVAESRARVGGVFCGGSVALFHRKRYSFAVKAGNNGEGHNHNDVGSFIVSAEGGQALADLGQPVYDRDYFSVKRYQNTAASSLWHSVPIVNGKGQCAGEEYGGTLSENGLSVEFSGAYENCKKLVRSFELQEDGVKVADEFSADDAVTERFVCLGSSAKIVSCEGIAPRAQIVLFRAHDGKNIPVTLLDFEVPQGQKSAAFCIFLKK